MRIHLHLNDPLLSTLDEEAKRTSSTRSSVIRASLASTLPQPPSYRDVSGVVIAVNGKNVADVGVTYVRIVPDKEWGITNPFLRLELYRDTFGEFYDETVSRAKVGTRIVATGVENNNRRGELTLLAGSFEVEEKAS